MTEHPRANVPVLITDAAVPYEQQLAMRKRRYAIMMGLRIPLMVAAVACAGVPWLAATLLVASIPLPWMAVLIANDRPPRKAENTHRYRRGPAALVTRDRTPSVTDGPSR